MKILFTTIVLLFTTLIANSQTYNSINSPSLSYLYNSTNEISTISNTEKLQLFPLVIGNKQAKFKLIKNKNGLFALVDGTGQVYKVANNNASTISFTRIDSTHFSGNTFGSIDFSNKETIYSFGGYGFWNRNGQLSHFTQGAEWSIDKINKRYTTLNTFYSYDSKKSIIYYILFPWNEESTNEKIKNSSVIEFDIDKKENTELGNLNPAINLEFKYFSIDMPSLNGIISYNDREIFLYNFSANKVYKLINEKIKDELIGKAGSELQTTFEDNGKLYYSFSNDSTLRSLTITLNDFKEEPYPIYITTNNANYKWLVILFIGIVLGILTIIIINKRKAKNKLVVNLTEEVYTTDLNSNEFNTIETTLINKLIEKSNSDSFLTVEELNTYLGIKKKTIEIQKRVRTEAINRINHKFNVNFNLETYFIERIRSDEDRRYFNYVINKENSKIYLRHLK